MARQMGANQRSESLAALEQLPGILVRLVIAKLAQALNGAGLIQVAYTD